MLTKIRNLFSLYRELGFRWSAFRVVYALRLRTGFIRLQMPQYHWNDRPLETWLKKDIPSSPEPYTQWRKENSPKFFFDEQPAGRVGLSEAKPVSRPDRSNVPWDPQATIAEADRILNGEIKYFAHEWIKTGFPPNWHHDYVTGIDIDSYKHWSQISDDANTDIKFIWDPNRFAFVYTLVRAYAATQDEKYAEAFWGSILDWAEHNPPNTGPNWMDGQEIAIRLMAWTFGYNAFLNSPSSTPERKSQFVLYVAAQAERIYKNINYAISTKSNHTISEAFGLWLVGLLFPELKDSEKYFSIGRKLLEQEAATQIFPDGTYSMYSLNYHRFILHIHLYAIRLGEINNCPFSTQLINSVTKSIEYLSHLIDPQTGQMPVYGSNDGALVLPLNKCDFTDYRPFLQLGWYITKKEFLFEPGPWDEDVFWLFGQSAARIAKRTLAPHVHHPAPVPDGKVSGSGSVPGSAGVETSQAGEIRSFPNGGTYFLRNTNSHAFIRCTDFHSRPSHADQLHVDLWIRGHNIAVDAGTYLYSGNGIWRNGLARTCVHNTVIVDGRDQMKLVSRFTWTNWSKGRVLQHNENLWQGEHDSYKPVSHRRTVMPLEDDCWLVIDHLVADEPHYYALHWLLNDFPLEQKENSVLLSLSGLNHRVQVGMVGGNGSLSIVRADPHSTRGWWSRYYGYKEPAISVMLEVNQSHVTFWSFFGFENDVVEVEGNDLKVNAKSISLVE